MGIYIGHIQNQPEWIFFNKNVIATNFFFNDDYQMPKFPSILGVIIGKTAGARDRPLLLEQEM